MSQQHIIFMAGLVDLDNDSDKYRFAVTDIREADTFGVLVISPEGACIHEDENLTANELMVKVCDYSRMYPGARVRYMEHD